MEPLASLIASHDTSGYRQRIGQAHGRDLPAHWGDVVDEMLVRLAASDAYLVQADLDDLIGETRPHNLPGRVVDGLWARRLASPTSEILADPDVRRRLSILGRTTS
jgi:4-alpha-glucanotransferase